MSEEPAEGGFLERVDEVLKPEITPDLPRLASSAGCGAGCGYLTYLLGLGLLNAVIAVTDNATGGAIPDSAYYVANLAALGTGVGVGIKYGTKGGRKAHDWVIDTLYHR